MTDAAAITSFLFCCSCSTAICFGSFRATYGNGQDPLRVIDAGGVWDWIYNYCAASLRQAQVDGATAFVKACIVNELERAARAPGDGTSAPSAKSPPPRRCCRSPARAANAAGYRPDKRFARLGSEAGVRVIVPELTTDCPQQNRAALMERCDILFPDLLKLFPPR